MNILYGKPIKQEIKAQLSNYVEKCLSQNIPVPHLAIVQVGNNPRSEVYIRQKEKFAKSIGAEATVFNFDENISPVDLSQNLKKIVDQKGIHGVILQMPLPAEYSKDELAEILSIIPVSKDADGLTLENAGLLISGSKKAIVPATTRGISNMLSFYKIPVEGKHVVVIGRSNLVGKPTAIHMMSLGATVTICHSKTLNLGEIISGADIVISATGAAKMISGQYLRAGQIVIDVGISIDGAGIISGDVDFDSASQVLGENGGISPVPGGVGPLTVAGLFQNLFDLHLEQIRLEKSGL